MLVRMAAGSDPAHVAGLRNVQATEELDQKGGGQAEQDQAVRGQQAGH